MTETLPHNVVAIAYLSEFSGLKLPLQALWHVLTKYKMPMRYVSYHPADIDLHMYCAGQVIGKSEIVTASFINANDGEYKALQH